MLAMLLERVVTASPSALLLTLRRSSVSRAAAWTMLAHFASQLLRIASSLIMTRLLVPEMFGLMALFGTIQIILQLLSDVGIRNSVIQSPRGDDPAFLNTAWTVQIIRGFILWAISILLALILVAANNLGLVAHGSVWGHPDLPLLLAFASFGTVIAGFQSTRVITANRHLDLKRPIAIELISHVGGMIVMIWLAMLTQSVWSLAAFGIATATIGTALSHCLISGIRNRILIDRSALHEMYTQGRWILLSSTAFVVASHFDRLALGALLDPATLGLYTLALTIVLIVEGLGHRMYSGVLLPALTAAARTHPGALAETLNRVRLPFDIALLGAAGGLYASGETIISILYDPRYRDAGWMLEALSFSLVFARYGYFNMAHVALGRSEWMAAYNIVKLVASIAVLFLLNAYAGVPGAIWATSLHGLIPVLLMFWLNREHRLNNWRVELLVLPAWGVGYLCGEIANALIG